MGCFSLIRSHVVQASLAQEAPGFFGRRVYLMLSDWMAVGTRGVAKQSDVF
jgi:hypothetical protein